MFFSEKTKKQIAITLGGLVCLNLITWVVVYDLSRAQGLEVIFFNVGQGDSIFIENSAGQQILIDGGPDSAVLEKLAEEMPFYDRTLDLIILTHPEHDHMAGLIEVLKRYEVENILWTGVVRNTAEYKEWQRLIEEEGAEIFVAKHGQRVSLSGSDPCIFLDILYPFENLESQKIENSNDTSIIARLVFNANSFLFTGDAGEFVENKLIENNIYLGSDVLKVGHHGSKYSTGEIFLKMVSPEIAVIQVGKNSYGHPTEEVLARLEKFAIKVLRTDLDGDIKIFSDGNKLKIKSQKLKI